MSEPRQEGYYWVRLKDDKSHLVLAEWAMATWWLIGTMSPFEDADMLFISDAPIAPPAIARR